MGERRVLEEALVKNSTNKRPHPNPKAKNKATDQQEDDDEPQEANPRRGYREPMKNIAAVIFGGKVGSESARECKLLTRAIIAMQNPNGPIADIKTPAWSEQPITFSRNDMWATFKDAGRFPLVLDPVIDGIRTEKVLVDGGSALNILFSAALKELGIPPEKLQPYDIPFWGIMPGKPSYPLG